MLKYIRGYIKDIIPQHKTLVIELANCQFNCDVCSNKARRTEDGQPFTKEQLELVLNMYKKHIDSICFVGGEDVPGDLVQLYKEIHKNGLEAYISTVNLSVINKALMEEIDYAIIGRCHGKKTIWKKDYCPFADACDWIELENTNILN